eukprot:GHVT01042336.1.p3 GENE.GHVT01042336.1~~GHVT01042336.1.p3  ORF type:complete len:136 (-),score=18.44 GHVT01042336.1:4095-4502(-)
MKKKVEKSVVEEPVVEKESSTKHTPAADGFEKGGENDVTGGLVKNRSCTDILFLLLFILATVASVGVAVLAYMEGKSIFLESFWFRHGSKFATSPSAKCAAAAAAAVLTSYSLPKRIRPITSTADSNKNAVDADF